MFFPPNTMYFVKYTSPSDYTIQTQHDAAIAILRSWDGVLKPVRFQLYMMLNRTILMDNIKLSNQENKQTLNKMICLIGTEAKPLMTVFSNLSQSLKVWKYMSAHTMTQNNVIAHVKYSPS
ncbi:hypothetical protein AMECASPLE_019078 [Ameca splendens]|uniref:Uncharacterized protein n=1 Tax=Ameca splendens TaxID=208324 RepID=A0ABV0XRS2_9TELE